MPYFMPSFIRIETTDSNSSIQALPMSTGQNAPTHTASKATWHHAEQISAQERASGRAGAERAVCN